MGKGLILNALASGLLASGCCILQLIASLVFGTGCLGIGKVLDPYRLYFTPLALLAHALLIKSRACCDKWSIRISWCVLIVLVLSPLVVSSGNQPPSDIEFKVGGIGCSACAAAARMALEGLHMQCKVQLDGKTSCLEADFNKTAVSFALESAGFTLLSTK